MTTPFRQPELETMDQLGALAESLKSRAVTLADELGKLSILAKLGRKEVLTAIETTKMADSWTKVTSALYSELTVLEKQVGNQMQRARMQSAMQALKNADWHRDFSTVAGQEGRQLAALAKNAGSLITALDLFINVATPDKTSFDVGSSAAGALLGMAAVALLPVSASMIAIGAVAVGGTLLGKAVFENFIAPSLGLTESSSPSFRDSTSQSLEIVLKAISNTNVRFTDELYFVDILRKTILGRNDPTAADDPVSYFQNLYDLNFATKQRYPNGVQAVPLTNLSALSIQQYAAQPGPAGDAYRYALRELHAVAVVGIDYAQHNADGSLNFSAHIVDQGMSQEYLVDRSNLLFWTIQRNLANSTGSISGGSGVSGVHFKDVRTETEFDLGLPDGVVEKRQTLFGGDGQDFLQGKALEDRLYGSTGDDVLLGMAGSDYIEGNAGNDALDGGAGSDLLRGGVGNDTLIGGEGNDIQLGGTGTDTYKFEGAHGLDMVKDSDGQGSLVVGAAALNGGKKIMDNAHRSADGTTTYTRIGNDLVIRNQGAATGFVVVKDWQPGQLGIELSDVSFRSIKPGLVMDGEFIKKLNDQETQYLIGSGGINYISGGPLVGSADLITGGDGAELIRGFSGADALLGRGGDDWIEGGDSGDVLMGGLGADWIEGGAGPDFILGSSGGALTYTKFPGSVIVLPDATTIATGFNWWLDHTGVDVEGFHQRILTTTVGRDNPQGDSGNLIWGGVGDDNDAICGMDGHDILFGGLGNDWVAGDSQTAGTSRTLVTALVHGNDVLDGGAGNDYLLGQGSDDVLYGGAGTDTLYGDDHNTFRTPVALNGSDWLDGGADSDKLYGGGGDDVLIGGAGNDHLEGGTGRDVYIFNRGDGVDTVVDTRSEGNVIRFGAGVNKDDIKLRLGSMLVDLGGGDSVHVENFDTQDASGSLAIDSFEFADGGVLGKDELLDKGFDIDGTAADDTIQGTSVTDRILAGAGADKVYAGAGDDVVDGGDDADQLRGGDGNDLLQGGEGSNELYGDGGDDVLQGGTGRDFLYGGAGADVLEGAAGDDVLDGGEGDYRLLGGQGNDQLSVSAGNDQLEGGEGDDRYQLGSGIGHVKIDDLAGNNLVVFGESVALTGLRGTVEADSLTVQLNEAQSVQVRGRANRFRFGSETVSFEVLAALLTGSTTTTPPPPPPPPTGGVVTNLVDADGNVIGSTVTHTGADGRVTVTTYSGGDASGQRLQHTWTAPDGSRGEGRLRADGFYESTDYGADGSRKVYEHDPVGNAYGAQYDALGKLVSDWWMAEDGSYGGRSPKPDGGWTVTVFYPDGTYTVDGVHFDAQGHPVGAPPLGPYSDFVSYPDGTYRITDHDGAGNNTSTLYGPARRKISRTWSQSDGSHGNDVFNADGSSVATVYAPGGNYTVTTDNGRGRMVAKDYLAGGSLTGSRITVKDGLNSITSHLNAAGTRVRETWVDPDGTTGENLISATDYNGIANMIAGLKERNQRDYEAWWADDDTAGVRRRNEGTYYTDWYFGDLPGDGKPAEAQGFARSTMSGGVYTGADYFARVNRLGHSGRSFSFETVYHRPPGSSSAGSGYDLIDNTSNLRLVGRQDLSGNRYLKFGAPFSAFGPEVLLGSAGVAVSKTIDGKVAGTYVILEEDGRGNLLLTTYATGGLRLQTMWFHNDGSHGGEAFNGDGSVSGFSFNKDGTAARYERSAMGQVSMRTYPSEDGTIDTGITQNPPAVITPPPPPPGLTSVSGATNQIRIIRLPKTVAQSDGEYTYLGSMDGFGHVYILWSKTKTNTLKTASALGNTNTLGTQVSVLTDSGFAAQTMADGGKVEWTYDAAGRPTTQTVSDTEGNATARTYDERGQLSGSSVTRVAQDGSLATLKYGVFGQFIGSSVETRPDAGTRRVVDFDATGVRSGSMLEVSDGGGNTIVSHYDAAENVLSFKTYFALSSNEARITSYDGNGKVKGIELTGMTEDGYIRTHKYNSQGDLLGSVIARIEADGSVLTRNYDARGQLLGYQVVRTDLVGDSYVTVFDAKGVKLREDVLKSNGVQATSVYEGSGGGTLSWWYPDGTSGTQPIGDYAGLTSHPIDAQQILEDQAWQFTVPLSAFRPANPLATLSYSASVAGADGMPQWLSFDASSRTFSGLPLNDHVGALAVTIKATDAAGLTATSTFTLQVANVNDAPVARRQVADQRVLEAEPWTLVVDPATFFDQDVGDKLNYRATLADGSALPNWLTFDPTALRFTGTPGKPDAGDFQVVLRAVDVAGATAVVQFGLHVESRNRPPVVATPVAAQSATEDEAWQFAVPASVFTDPDAGDALTYSASLAGGGPLPEWLSFDAQSRTFRGTPLNANVGGLTLMVTATDASAQSASATFTVTVGNVNDAPQVGLLIPNQQVAEDTQWSFVLPADAFTDVDAQDTLTFVATLADGGELPVWLSFDPVARRFSGTPGNGDVGGLELRVTATDTSGASASAQFSVSVLNTNDAPMPSRVLQPQGGTEGQPLHFVLPADTFTDVDAGDVLTYSAGQADGSALPGWLSFDAATRSFSGTPPGGTALQLRVTSTDAAGASASQDFTLRIGVHLRGGNGKDTLEGTEGNDLIDGGAGKDVMQGGLGDDVYVVDMPQDEVIEFAGGGTDTVRTSQNKHVLAAHVENLQLTGTDAVFGYGNELDNRLMGNAASNRLFGGQGDDFLDGGAGDDVLIGEQGSDTYFLGRGRGSDTIQEDDATQGHTDVVLFGDEIAADQLWFRRVGKDLEVSVIGSSDRLLVDNWYEGGQYRVEEFRTADGKLLLGQQVQQLVDAMAAFAPPPAGQTTLATAYQTSLTPVIAANWQ